MNNLYFKGCLCEIETPLEEKPSYKFNPLYLYRIQQLFII